MAIGAQAQTTIFDAAATDWGSADLTGEVTVGTVTWHGRGSAAIDTGSKTFSDDVKWDARLKFGGSSTFKTGSTLAGVFTFTPTKAGKVKVYCVGGGSGDRTTYISQSITSTNRDVTTALGSYTSSDQALGIAEATVEPNQMVYVWADSNVGVYGITFEETEIVATDPVFSLSKTSINTLMTSQIKVGEKAGLDGLTLSGLTYDSNVISIDETGKITPVAAGTSTITFSTAATEKYKASSNNNLTIEVVAVTLDELTDVTDNATWDWSEFGTTEIELTETSSLKKTDEFVLSNIIKYGYCESIGESFGNAQQLKVTCQYAVRGGQYFQGPSIKFNTTTAGKLSVTYSNTGTRSDEAQRRFLNVNGTNQGDGTMDTEAITTSDIAVAAGEVAISGKFGPKVTDQNAQFLRIYKIVFTKGSSDGIENVKVNTDVNAPIYNLAGQKVSESYKGVVIQNGKKFVK